MNTAVSYEQIAALEAENRSFVLVVLVDALGSTPQDAGAKMIVTEAGRHGGTVGGGRIEAKALDFARQMLVEKETQPRFVNWTLRTDVGMTCGGSVKLYFEPHRGGGNWPIAIFGAGHVAQALVPVLLPLACSLSVHDSRPEWLNRFQTAPNLRVVTDEALEQRVGELSPDTFVLCMTRGHTTDAPILRAALLRGCFPFIGVIGSDSKAAVLRRELLAQGVTAEQAKGFHCPIGLSFGSNHPHEIALSIAAQLISERDRLADEASRRRAATGISP